MAVLREFLIKIVIICCLVISNLRRVINVVLLVKCSLTSLAVLIVWFCLFTFNTRLILVVFVVSFICIW